MEASGDRRPAFNGRTLTVFGAVALVYAISTGFASTAYNNHVLLADAWLHGRLWIFDHGPAIDALAWNGHLFIIEGPLPAVLLLPLVAIFHESANQSLVCALCGAAAVAAADLALGRLGVAGAARNATTAFVAFGTVLWWCSAFGAVWMFAHVVGAMFAFFALAEWFGARRPWLVGMWFACAAMSRFPMALGGVAFFVLLALEREGDQRWKALGQFALGVLPFALADVAYNVARWGTPFDIGYTEWYHRDQVGMPTGSPFRVQYLPFNLYSFLMLAPDFSKEWPWLRPGAYGVSLVLTSPALALALNAGLRDRTNIALGAAAVACAVPALLYYVNGFEQFGMRHALDFLPFLAPLVARALDRRCGPLEYALLAWSVAANAYGVWYSWAFHAYAVVPR